MERLASSEEREQCDTLWMEAVHEEIRQCEGDGRLQCESSTMTGKKGLNACLFVCMTDLLTHQRPPVCGLVVPTTQDALRADCVRVGV